MLVQCSKCIIFATTEIAFKAGAVPSSAGGDVLSVESRVGKQLVCQYAAGISLTDSREYRVVIEILGSLA
jgi:hypothetical protein